MPCIIANYHEQQQNNWTAIMVSLWAIFLWSNMRCSYYTNRFCMYFVLHFLCTYYCVRESSVITRNNFGGRESNEFIRLCLVLFCITQISNARKGNSCWTSNESGPQSPRKMEGTYDQKIIEGRKAAECTRSSHRAVRLVAV